MRKLPSVRRRPGLLINPLLGHDTCCCLPSSGSRLVCWPPPGTNSAFCFLIGIPGGGGALKKVSAKCSGPTKQLELSPPNQLRGAAAPPAEPPRLDYDSRRCFVNAPPPAAVLPVHAQIDCKPLQSFRPGSEKEIQLNQYLISRPIDKLSNVSLKKKSIQRCFAVQS